MIELDTGTEELLCSIRDRVAVITLNKPGKKNALGDLLTPALREILRTVEADERVGCVMITGTGDAFCAGGDVTELGGGRGGGRGGQSLTREARIAALVHKQETLTLRLHELHKLTVAALPGAAAGAGLSIALACDFRLASGNAFITTAFKNIGLSGDYGGSWFLPRLIGLARAKELFYLSDRIDAETCLSIGLFNRVFPEASFREDAFEFARRLAYGPSLAYSRMKKNLNDGMDMGLRESLELEATHMVDGAG